MRKIYLIGIALAVALVLCFTTNSPTTVSAQQPPMTPEECGVGGTGGLVQNGVFTSQECKALVVAGLDCYYDLLDTLPADYQIRASDVSTWFANEPDLGNLPLACREFVGLAGDCRDWAVHGINPEADTDACESWVKIAFSPYSHVSSCATEEHPGAVDVPTLGCGDYEVPINADGPPTSLIDVICGDYPAKSYCPEPELAEESGSVDVLEPAPLEPPAAGSEGLKGPDVAGVPLTALIASGVALWAFGSLTLGQYVLARRKR